MNKIKEFFTKTWNKIGTDGLLHFFACFGIAAILANYVNIRMAFFISVFIGFLKEIIWDGALKKGQFQWKDLWFDLAGAASAFLILIPKLLSAQAA